MAVQDLADIPDIYFNGSDRRKTRGSNREESPSLATRGNFTSEYSPFRAPRAGAC